MAAMKTSDLPKARDGRRLVLLVDDCLDSREMYAEYLGDEFAIAQAGNGLEAIDQALALLPDVVVMDLTLPGMNGKEASVRLKRDPRTRLIPLVVVSGQEEPVEPHAKPIWDAFLSKPCRLSVLASEIRRAIDSTSSTAPNS